MIGMVACATRVNERNVSVQVPRDVSTDRKAVRVQEPEPGDWSLVDSIPGTAKEFTPG